MRSATIEKHKASKKVLILETMNTKLSADKDAPYTFVGPCAEFDTMNENDRNYDKDDYLSHFDYLIPEIEENSLLGELDHRDEYVPSMKSISHMIKGLWYDEKTRQVMIKIQLVNTREGKDAMALADAGAPIYISSRASGYIDDEGNVTLERIYTYDIVYRPGFRNAKLKRIEESSKLMKSSSRAVYEWAGSGDTNSINKRSRTNNENTMADNFVKEEDFIAYTKKTSSLLEEIKKSLNENKVKNNASIPAGKHSFGAPVKLNEDEGGEQPGGEQPGANQAVVDPDDEAINKKIEDIEATIKDGTIEKEAVLEFLNMVGNRTNRHSKYISEMGGFSNEMAEAIDNINEQLGAMTRYINLVAERLNVIDSDLTSTNENQEISASHNKLVVERVNSIAKYANVLRGGLNSIQESVNAIKKQAPVRATVPANESVTDVSERVNKFKQKIAESKVKNIAPNKGKGALTSQVEKIIENAKKKQAGQAKSLNESYPFTKVLDSQTKARFSELDPIKKKEIASMVAEKKITVASEIGALVKEINEGESSYHRLLVTMPKKLVSVWEKLGPKARNRVVSLYNMKGIQSTEDTELFWEGIDLGDTSALVRIVEDNNNIHDEASKQSSGINDTSGLGYSVEDVENSLI